MHIKQHINHCYGIYKWTPTLTCSLHIHSWPPVCIWCGQKLLFVTYSTVSVIFSLRGWAGPATNHIKYANAGAVSLLLCLYKGTMMWFIHIYRPFRGKSCLSRNRNLVFFFGICMLLWSLFCCCVATNHIYVALTMNSIADVLIVTRIPPHLRSPAIFLARQHGTCNWLQSDYTVHMLVETKIWSYLHGNNCSFRCVYTRAVYIHRWGKMGPIFSLIDYIF